MTFSKYIVDYRLTEIGLCGKRIKRDSINMSFTCNLFYDDMMAHGN